MKTMKFNDFQNKWKSMTETANSYLSLGINHPLNFQIGYSNDNYKSLVIMNTGIVEDVPSSYAIHASNQLLLNGKYVLSFKLVYGSLEEEFLRLCWDMIQASQKSDQPLNNLLYRYMSWQRLLQYLSTGIMSFQRQKGLLGELLYLSELIDDMGENIAVNAWTGPDGSDQDFMFGNTWTEVKTVAIGSKSVKISSLEQLNQETDGILAVYVLEKTTPGKERVSLVDIVNEVKEKLSSNPVKKEQFEMKIFKYGYREKDEKEYNKNQFRFIEKIDYLVDKSFPKLTKDNVPVGITECKYELSLPSLDSFRRK